MNKRRKPNNLQQFERVARALRLAAFVGVVLIPELLSAQSLALFPRPVELEPAINFWVRVYTEVDTGMGFLHDSEHLAVVYERLPLKQTQIEANRSRIQQDLRALGAGKRTNLTQSQQKILALWPAGVSDQTLRSAASNVRWQLGQSDRFLEGLEHSGAYRQHINNVIRQKGLPLELAVLPHVAAPAPGMVRMHGLMTQQNPSMARVRQLMTYVPR